MTPYAEPIATPVRPTRGQKTKAPAVARRKYEHEERTKLPGDKYCSPCGRYTDTFEFRGEAVCKECGEER